MGGMEMLLQQLQSPTHWQHPLSFLTRPGHPQPDLLLPIPETHQPWKTVKLPETHLPGDSLKPLIFQNLPSSQLFFPLIYLGVLLPAWGWGGGAVYRAHLSGTYRQLL